MIIQNFNLQIRLQSPWWQKVLFNFFLFIDERTQKFRVLRFVISDFKCDENVSLYLSHFFSLREFPRSPVQFSTDNSVTVGDSVLVQISGDEDSKNILVSWSHQVCRNKNLAWRFFFYRKSHILSDGVFIDFSAFADFFSVLPIFRISADIRSFELSALSALLSEREKCGKKCFQNKP